MVTRCPSCATLFRVTSSQLQARRGQVRCGRCMTVFDGFQALATLSDQTGETAPAAPGTDDGRAARGDEGVSQDVPAAPTPATSAHEMAPAGFEFGPLEEDAQHEAVNRPRASFEPLVRPASLDAGKLSPPAASSSPPIRGDELFLEQARSAPRRNTRAWMAGSILMLLALAAQALYVYRTEIAANSPMLKPVVVRLCELAACTVPLPQRPRLINIEATDLQSVDPARPELIQLTATLRNHAGYDLGYPALDLVLTNTRDHTLARRIFLPEEYLDKGRDVPAGIPASAEFTIRLSLDTGELGAAGFRLDLLPASPR